jgi:Tfp pilus assembly protein PilF
MAAAARRARIEERAMIAAKLLRPKSSASLFRRLCPLLLGAPLLVAAGGCATAGSSFIVDRDHLAMVLRSRNLEADKPILPFELNEEMRRFAHETAPAELPALQKLELLRNRLLDPNQMKVKYSWGYTGTAEEVFVNREANCLAFTNLFVGLAREVGVKVFFLSVANVETYRKEGDLVLVSDHVAVGYGDSSTSLAVYDFSEHQEIDTADRRFVKKISDLTAIAMFYSNRGAEALRAGLEDSAVKWVHAAVLIDPELANGWVNYGVTQRRVGDLEGAEQSYRKAIVLDPRIYSAYNNLAALLRQQGRNEEAKAYERELLKGPNQNPYTYLSLGDISLRSGRFDEAADFYRRAAGLSTENSEALAALGQLAVARGDLRTAKKMLKKAQETHGSDLVSRVNRLADVIAAADRPEKMSRQSS